MNKLICVVGPTATGKTAKAVELSKEFPSIIVSADSRQVYRGMDIVTGKDHDKDTLIYGLDLVNPDEDCSVALWYDQVIPLIESAWKERKQVIAVGGTGLYIKALTDGIETMQIPLDQSLRDELSQKSLLELQERLSILNPTKFNSLNESDVKNPRRLIRAIEIERSSIKPNHAHILAEVTMLGRRYSSPDIYRSVIRDRVLSRLKSGAIAETIELRKKYGDHLASMSAIGYRSINKYLSGQIGEQAMIDDWVDGELSYAKRQMTWFNKVKSIEWYDIAN